MGFRIVDNKFEYIDGYKTNIELAQLVVKNFNNIIFLVNNTGFEEEISSIIHRYTKIVIENTSSTHIDLDLSKINMDGRYDIEFIKFNVKNGEVIADQITFTECHVDTVVVEGSCIITNPLSINNITANIIRLNNTHNFEEVEIKNDVYFKAKIVTIHNGRFNNIFIDAEASCHYGATVGNVVITGSATYMALNTTEYINYNISSSKQCEVSITNEAKLNRNQFIFNRNIYFTSNSYNYLVSQNIRLIDPQYPTSPNIKQLSILAGFNHSIIKLLTKDEIQLLKRYAEAPLIEYFISIGDTDFIEERLSKIKTISVPTEYTFKPFKIDNTIKFLKKHPNLISKYLTHIKYITEPDKQIADLYKILYNNKIEKIHGGHINDYTGKFISQSATIVGVVPNSCVINSKNLFGITNINIIEKVLSHMTPASIDEMAHYTEVFNISYPGLNTKISLKEYLFITRYMNKKVFAHRLNIDRWDMKWIKSHINIEYLIGHFYRLFVDTGLNGAIFTNIYKGNEIKCLKAGIESRNTPLVEYVVNDVKSNPKIIPLSVLQELIYEMGLYPARYGGAESILFYALTKQIKITPDLYKKLLNSEKYSKAATDYASLIDLNAWKKQEKSEPEVDVGGKQITIKLNSPLLNKLVQNENKKISKQVLFSKTIRNNEYIYLDTINELKASYNKSSPEYNTLKQLEMDALKNKGSILVNELQKIDKIETIEPKTLFDTLLKIEQVNIENNELYNNSPRQPGYIYKDTIESYNEGQSYLTQIPITTLLNNGKISIEQMSTMNEYDNSEMMKKIFTKVTTMTNYICEQKKCNIKAQSLHSKHDVFRCNYKSVSELKHIAAGYIMGDKIIESIDDYLTITHHPVNKTHLTLVWIRFEIFEDIKTIWVNENQTDMTKKLGFSEWNEEYSDKLNDKLLFNCLLLFQKWIRAHYPEFTVVLPGYLLRKKILMGDPVPSGYDNPAKKLGFKKTTLNSTPMQTVKIRRKQDGLVWIWSPLTEEKQI